MQQDWQLIADGPMRPIFDVVSAPILQLFLRVGKRQEPAGVQAFGPQASVKRFDEGIISRLSISPEQLARWFVIRRKVRTMRPCGRGYASGRQSMPSEAAGQTDQISDEVSKKGSLGA